MERADGIHAICMILGEEAADQGMGSDSVLSHTSLELAPDPSTLMEPIAARRRVLGHARAVPDWLVAFPDEGHMVTGNPKGLR